VVYLDEPTIGLDLIVKERIREFIKQQNQTKGTTVVLTTHDLGDIEELCQRVIIIDAGVLIYDGPIETIKQRFGRYREITFETLSSAAHLDLPPSAQVIVAEPGHDPAHADDRAGAVTVRFDRTATTASQVAAALMNQLEVKDFSLSEPDLASIIKQIYNGALSEEQAA
jgi:ABC-2 type transport system ATP-binding protein